jgi:hypothetical protein
MDEERLPTTGFWAGIALAAAGLLFASATDGPYLTTDDVNGWIVVFAAGLFGALIAIPFMLERRMRPRVSDRDKRWERALLGWGAIAIGVLFAGGMLGLANDYASSGLGGALGLVITFEAGLVLATMVFWLLSG